LCGFANLANQSALGWMIANMKILWLYALLSCLFHATFIKTLVAALEKVLLIDCFYSLRRGRLPIIFRPGRLYLSDNQHDATHPELRKTGKDNKCHSTHFCIECVLGTTILGEHCSRLNDIVCQGFQGGTTEYF
jgi:hypothetical protein